MLWTYNMYVSAVPGDNMAVLVVPSKGSLLQIDWHLRPASAGADFNQTYEVSRAPTAGMGINGTDFLFSTLRHAQEFTTSGVVNEAINWTQFYAIAPQVTAGERMYLNCGGTAITISGNLLFHFSLI